jgi:hypothetical protein
MLCNQAVSNQILTVYQTQQPEILTLVKQCLRFVIRPVLNPWEHPQQPISIQLFFIGSSGYWVLPAASICASSWSYPTPYQPLHPLINQDVRLLSCRAGFDPLLAAPPWFFHWLLGCRPHHGLYECPCQSVLGEAAPDGSEGWPCQVSL